MTSRPRRSPRRGPLAAAGLVVSTLLVAVVAGQGRVSHTTAAWLDRTAVAGSVATGDACSGSAVEVFPSRTNRSDWDVVDAVQLFNLAPECSEGGQGLPGTMTIVGPDGDILSSGDLLYPGGANGEAFAFLDGSFDWRLTGGEGEGAQTILQLDGWPVPATWRAPVVAVGGSNVWVSDDHGATWSHEATVTGGTMNAVATDGQGVWVAVGRDTAGKAAIWFSLSWRLSTWYEVDLGPNPGDPLYAVAASGDGSWAAVGGAIEDLGLTHRAAMWVSSSGVSWTAVDPANIQGPSIMLTVATDGRNWVAGGGSRAGLGTTWTTTTTQGQPVPSGTWTCAASHRTEGLHAAFSAAMGSPPPWITEDPACSAFGPRAAVQGSAADGSGRWSLVGSGYGDTTLAAFPGYGGYPVGCPPPADVWTASGNDRSTWAGSTLAAPAPSSCATLPHHGGGAAVGMSDGTPASARWLAVGSTSSPASAMGVWDITDPGQPAASPVLSQATEVGTAIATDHEGVWLATSTSTIWRSTADGAPGTWEAVADVGPVSGIAFSMLLPKVR